MDFPRLRCYRIRREMAFQKGMDIQVATVSVKRGVSTGLLSVLHADTKCAILLQPPRLAFCPDVANSQGAKPSDADTRCGGE